EKTLERIDKYISAGAEMLFLEGATDLSQYQTVTQAFKIPVLANITEFGVTPLFSKAELQQAGIQLILYPLSAFRMMSAAAIKAYETIRMQGSQKSLVSEMQTREQLYDVLDYYQYE